jgi:hypothetical protein
MGGCFLSKSPHLCRILFNNGIVETGNFCYLCTPNKNDGNDETPTTRTPGTDDTLLSAARCSYRLHDGIEPV